MVGVPLLGGFAVKFYLADAALLGSWQIVVALGALAASSVLNALYYLPAIINIWSKDHPRTARLNAFCKSLTAPEKHVNTWKKMNDEELANLSLTLIHQSTYLIEHYLRMLEQRFITQGGISEAMTRARQNHRHF
jgi:four helix bundle suffix protein